MYSFIRGIITEKVNNTVVLDNNGIGYLIYISNNSLSKLGELGEETTLYTFLNVREDEMTLFGFADKVEKETFMKLILVNGVGPKMAINILSSMSVQDLSQAIITQNGTAFKNVKGVGTKIRERIMLELKEKMDNVLVQNADLIKNMPTNSIIDTAIGVLVDWGVNRINAQEILSRVYQENDSMESLISKAFREMGR